MILDGKKLAADIKADLKDKLARAKKDVTLAVVLVGEDPASCIYVKNKTLDCREVGIHSLEYRLPAGTTQEELMTLIDRLNADDAVHGILVQFPLPRHLDEAAVVKAILPHKDVDGFSRENIGGVLMNDADAFVSCTPAGAMALIRQSGVDVCGKRAVVIGRSNNVGKPMALLLLHAGATVTICHSKTRDLPSITREADILVCAVGKAHMITRDMVKPGAVVIDIGISRIDGKQVGDVDFDAVKDVAFAVTPNPGGTGPMTRAMLLVNTLKAAGIR
ncbi:MAG: bifunctional 5,10-methylenetetrahydrofolate dehydrogenase/5,10-methenyltetrahydrofolate cyclohydrolase [Clostridia bacterium]|nr:bifunctional 5,10-methylenetetrahydrofolate dehydrogenase/5,10-methenyltetrahydrofolate cyclohydrolase [Clostridia bacterium]